MRRFGFLRRWSGTLLAALMAVTLLVPTLDSFVCIADIAPQAVKQDIQMAAKQIPAQQQQQDQDDVDPLCPHGHCHHLLVVTRLAERQDFVPSVGFFEPAGGNYESPPSAPRTELLRPPRA